MPNEDVRPTTVVGIKRLAKTIKGQRSISHTEALNEAARRAGFENFRHASNRLQPLGALRQAPSRKRLYLTGYWKDRESGARGRETTWVDLSTDWPQLVTRTQMNEHRSLVRLVPEAADHLAYQYMFSSQPEARRTLCGATRTFQFMDVTHLRPTRAHSRIYPGGTAQNRIPGSDHPSRWYDPQTKGYVYADEPYEPAVADRVDERAAWAAKHAYDIAKPNWPGMYNPGGPEDKGGSRLYLIADRAKGPSVAALAAALDRLPPPMLEETWEGESGEGLSRFKSPAELAPAPIALAAPTSRMRLPRAGQAPRPGKMPIEVHEEVGRKLRAVIAESLERDGVYNRLDRVRSELDDWIQREYDYEQLPMERFRKVYYGSSPSADFGKSLPASRIADHVKALEEVKAEVGRHYESSQTKSLLGRIDSAIKSLQKWSKASK